MLERWGIIGGYDLGQDYAHLKDHMLVAVTEMNRKDEIDALATALGELSPRPVRQAAKRLAAKKLAAKKLAAKKVAPKKSPARKPASNRRAR